MTALLKSKTLHVSMQCPPKKIYEFVSHLRNLPRWATAFCQSIKKVKGQWIAQTPQGPVKIRMARKNNFGVLDHYVIPAPNVEVFVPMRVVANGRGSEVIFTLFQSVDMSEEKFTQDIRWVEQDLKMLKKMMER